MGFELTKEYLDEVFDAIDRKDIVWFEQHLFDLHDADIADLIDELDEQQAAYIYALLDDEQQADVLTELDEDTRENLISNFSSKEIAEQVENLDSDDAADIIGELPQKQIEEVIAHISDDLAAEEIVDLLNYDEDTAGGLMQKEFIQAKLDWPVNRCIVELRRQAEEVEKVYTIYVIDDMNKLVGFLSLKRLLFASPTTKISDLYQDKNIISVKTSDDDEFVARIMEKYDLVVIPVLSEDKKLLGRITIDDALDVIKEEAEKDYQMASGISEKVESSDSLFVISRARLPWLLIGLLGGILGAYVIGFFEEHLRENAVMASFIPLILAMGGNVGVQSSAIIVQSLANNTLNYESIFKRLLKELTVALFNGFICAIIALIFCWITRSDFALALTIGVSLVAVFTYAGLFGTFVPLILNKYKIDPALATGPFITTTNDIIGLLIYFLIGMALYF